MRKLTFLLLLCSCVSFYAFSQNITIKGSLLDSTEKKNLTNSVIVVMRKADSVMVGFARSDKAGNFILKKVPEGKSIIMITHPAYADYIDEMDITATSPVDLGKIFMIQKSQLLQEVIVSNAGAIRIKGDTTEFKADSFHLKAGSTVEDLLKKLPGIQVDKKWQDNGPGTSCTKSIG